MSVVVIGNRAHFNKLRNFHAVVHHRNNLMHLFVAYLERNSRPMLIYLLYVVVNKLVHKLTSEIESQIKLKLFKNLLPFGGCFFFIALSIV